MAVLFVSSVGKLLIFGFKALVFKKKTLFETGKKVFVKNSFEN